jgi:hypothetical protein
MRRPFGAEAIHDASSAIGRLPSLPYAPFPYSTGAFSMSGTPGRSALSAPKPRNAEQTAGKSAPMNSIHAIQVKLALLLNLFHTY